MAGRKILISGATGFLGSHLVRALVDNGDDVTILKRSTSNISRIADLLGDEKFIDVDKDPIKKAFASGIIYDAVLNTAGLYGRHGETSASILQSNLCFAVELLQISAKYNVRRFINANTSSERLLNDYALSKHQFSEWGKLYAEKSNMAVYDILMEHVYGPDDDNTKFVDYVIDSCLANVEDLPLTRGEQERDFIYVDDVVSAYLMLINAPMTGYQQIGLGTGTNICIRDLVEKIHELTKSTTKLNYGAVPYRSKETMESNPNLAILHLLGWRAKIDIEEGIKKILEAKR